jgi:hypothetical protein
MIYVLGLFFLMKGDTLHVQPSDLDIAHLQTGNYSYLIVRQKAKDSPAMSMILAKMSVDRISYHGRPAIAVRQQWDRDSVVHRAYSVFDGVRFRSEGFYFEAVFAGYSGFRTEELRGGAGGIFWRL